MAPSAGDPTKPDSIPGIRVNQATARPTTEILLRIRSVIESKFREQYQSHLINGIVNKDDAYIVAVNSAKFGHDRWNWMPPSDILSAVYPFGDLQITFDRTTTKEVDRSYTYRAEVKKAKGSSVSTNLFLQEDFRPLSAVLYSCVDPIYKGATLGDDYVLVHNIKTQVAVQKGLVGRGKEYSATQDEENLYLHVHDWQEPSDSDADGSRQVLRTDSLTQLWTAVQTETHPPRFSRDVDRFPVRVRSIAEGSHTPQAFVCR